MTALGAAAVYGVAGILFAAWFVVRGADRLDPAVRGSGPVFRMIIAPASAALWPYLLYLAARRRE